MRKEVVLTFRMPCDAESLAICEDAPLYREALKALGRLLFSRPDLTLDEIQRTFIDIVSPFDEDVL